MKIETILSDLWYILRVIFGYTDHNLKFDVSAVQQIDIVIYRGSDTT